MTDKEDTRKKILHGTLDILGKTDVQNITVRMIARETGVNIALIKYYFGSKEKLVEESLASFGDHIATMLGDLEVPGARPEERLRHFVFSFVKLVTRFSVFTRSVLLRFIKGQRVPKRAFENIDRARNTLSLILREMHPALPDLTLRHMVFQMMSCIVYPVMLGRGVKIFLGTELKSEKEWQDYISCLLDAYASHRKGEK